MRRLSRFWMIDLLALNMEVSDAICSILTFASCSTSAAKWTVGGNMGWATIVKYTLWAQD
ncbi:hypothetical protein SLEP1_g18386 [Rubroshorea leprosula]|uniref:Uncharacterized protein n=1 Tax=Rubroshorea leprosula TaxID=152421 RepID=A0AAV5J650_9ROSI|nr:hypothetical protein SLEP1_g18386 [Rubroshorea leprosula]